MKYYRFDKGELVPTTEEQFKILEAVNNRIFGQTFCLGYEHKGETVKVSINNNDLLIKQ